MAVLVAAGLGAAMLSPPLAIGAGTSADGDASTVADSAETNAAPANGRAVKVPAGWLRGSGPSGHEKALELQEASGLDMLVLFYREDPKDEKGLLRWFEKKALNEAHVLKQMRGYIKVRIDATQNDRRTRALVDDYHVGKTPRLVVRRPDGFTARVDVFEWPGGKPELVKPLDLVDSLKEASSPSYREEKK
jgi:hypothetical protein